jgi:hypothetical protein
MISTMLEDHLKVFAALAFWNKAATRFQTLQVNSIGVRLVPSIMENLIYQ